MDARPTFRASCHDASIFLLAPKCLPLRAPLERQCLGGPGIADIAFLEQDHAQYSSSSGFWKTMVRSMLLIHALALVLSFPSVFFATAKPPTGTIVCAQSDVIKTFGGTRWRVFVCDNGSVSLNAMPGNPAFPTTLKLSPVNETYVLSGTTRGDPATVEAAVKDIQALTAADIKGIILETRARPITPMRMR